MDDEAALLAELKAISNQSAQSRFDRIEMARESFEEEDEKEVKEPSPPPKKASPSPGKKASPLSSLRSRFGTTPPWKKKKQQQELLKTTTSEGESTTDLLNELRNASLGQSAEDPIVVSQPDSPQDRLSVMRRQFDDDDDHANDELLNLKTSSEEASAAHTVFQGEERGGDAHDPELLALLKGAGSSANSRFKDESAPVGKESPPPAPVRAPSPKPPSSVVRAPSPARAPSPKPFPQQSSNFQGERGGDAHDPELLALLRGASNANSRFRGDGEPPSPVPQQRAPSPAPPKREPSPVVRAPSPARAPSPKPFPPQSSTFQGERGGDAHDPELLALLRGASNANSRFREEGEQPSPVPQQRAPSPAPPKRAPSPVVRAPSPKPFPQQSSNFQGDRGGDAHDPELLALLRGASNANSRFQDESATNSKEPAIPSQAPPTAAPASLRPTTQSATSSAPPLDVDVNREDLPTAWKDKNWKVRSAAYDLLKQVLLEKVQNETVEASDIFEELDESLPDMLADSNAGALDRAIDFALSYSEHCPSAGRADQASSLVRILLQKNGFSGRPTTTQAATQLTLKLVEVGESTESAHAVVTVLLDEGLHSKKPKVVLAAANTLLEIILEFGIIAAPTENVIDALPKALANTNAKVRDFALQITAELCRALGMSSVQRVVDTMKKAQVSDLETMLEKDPKASEPRSRLKCFAGENVDVKELMEANAKELAARRFAEREPVDLMSILPKTDFQTKINLSKWSEKVSALKIVLECAGETPYKLVDQSSSTSYAPLISEMKKTLSHTHFAVVTKAMEVLAMLAQGVGEKLYPFLRPVLTTIASLLKDKKLTKAAGDCLDAFFGNVLSFDHLLESDDSLPAALDEKKQKNALVRSSVLEFLGRCIDRQETAGPRGSLTPKTVAELTNLVASKLDDSDASVRKAAVDTLVLLQNVEDTECADIVSKRINQLQSTHPRAYKTLMRNTGDASTSVASTRISASRSMDDSPEKPLPTQIASKRLSPGQRMKAKTQAKSGAGGFDSSSNKGGDEAQTENLNRIDYETAMAIVEGLVIPRWESEEDEGGILAGLKATKWLLRQDAIKSITAFIESGDFGIKSESLAKHTSAILAVVGEHTREFKETNVNIMKAILELFGALAVFHEDAETPFPEWCTKEGSQIAVSKLSDKKLSTISQETLTMLCAVSVPGKTVSWAVQSLKDIKSPISHEEFLGWLKQFLDSFGVLAISDVLGDLAYWIVEEFENNNPKVKRSANTLAGQLHRALGPSFKALVLSVVEKQDTKVALEKCFDSYGHDPSVLTKEPTRRSIVSSASDGASSGGGLSLKVPSSDLFANIPDDCPSDLVATNGKASWKLRKQALDDIEKGLKDCTGLIDSEGPKLRRLVELMRGLRDRLSDTQINLKPVAARVCGEFLSRVDKSTQAKLGRIVFSALISSAMNDIKKPMRDACLEALSRGTRASNLDGDGYNPESLEAFVAALVEEVTEASSKAAGLPDVLNLVLSLVSALPDLDTITASRGQSLGEKFGSLLVECLTSSKAETRSAAASLLEEAFANEIVSYDSVRRSSERLKPAKQRSIGPLIAKYSRKAPSGSSESMAQPVSRTEEIRRPERTASTTATPTRVAKTSRIAASPVEKMAEIQQSSNHPLESSTVSMKRISPSVAWPDYPEEPMGPVLFASIRKCWSPQLPKSSIQILFPNADLRKQDDAQFGVELLRKSVKLDSETGSEFVVSQLEHILKWTAFVYSLKEATVGLQNILSFVEELLGHLVDCGRELTDSEAMILLPFLIEKSCLAKGRLRDNYTEINNLVSNERLVPPKTLGGLVCTALLERSPHLRVKSQAAHLCGECVDKEGLTGVGKRGVVAAAKHLSEATLPDLKAGALEMMIKILERMSGDMSKLARICGPALSPKAKQELQEHARSIKSQPTPRSKTTPRQNSASRVRVPLSTAKAPATDERHADLNDDLENELPAFTLRSRFEAKSSPETSSAPTGNYEASKADGFSFSLRSKLEYASSGSQEGQFNLVEEQYSAGKPAETSSQSTLESDGQSSNSAAALRARLMKIRERSKRQDGLESSNDDRNDDTLVLKTPLSPKEEFDRGIESMKSLTLLEVPIREDEETLVTTVNALKKFHSALSSQHGSGSEERAALLDLRGHIFDNMNATIESLTSLIGFSFRCGDIDSNAGLSVPLLSVCLATLMALFRDPEMAAKVDEDDMIILIREAGTALLDERLSTASTLDEGTSSQMVRAINKLAVQAATGAPRHVSLQALLMLQQQLSLDNDDSIFTSRLSRVVSKLFTRVIKSEEELDSPFSDESVDMEVLMCAMEDTLVTSQENDTDSTNTCAEMVDSLVKAIVATRGAPWLLSQMSDLGLGDDSLLEGRVREASSGDDYMLDVGGDNGGPAQASTSSAPVTPAKNKSVATLVANIANAPEGPQRDAAVEELRDFNLKNGKGELTQHLMHVSSPFRSFIEEQIGEETQVESSSMSRVSNSGSMSERLRSLRSRLQATEAVVQEAVEGPSENQSPSKPLSPDSDASSVRRSRLAQPTPSKIPAPASTSGTSLRDRLASLQENRTSSSDTGDATSRAAALRARLEAVKQQP